MKKEEIDITERELENKKKSSFKIDDEKVHYAAGYAIIEGKRWSEAADILYVGNRKLTSQICVNALFAIEVYLKSILFNMGVNVTRKKFGHDIYSMYDNLDEELKNEIKKDVTVDYEIYNFFKEVIKFKTFEEELEYISNDFKYLRYEYEKFLNGISIFTLTDFIMNIKKNIEEIAFRYNAERNIY